MIRTQNYAPTVLIVAAAVASIATSMPSNMAFQQLSFSEPLSGSLIKQYKVQSVWSGAEDVEWRGEAFTRLHIRTSTLGSNAVSSSTIAPRIRMVLAHSDAPYDLVLSSMAGTSSITDERIVVDEAELVNGRLMLGGDLKLFDACTGSCNSEFILGVMHTNPNVSTKVIVDAQIETAIFASDNGNTLDMTKLTLDLAEVN